MELPNRKSTRLKDYDYAYFVTICTQNKEIIFDLENVGNDIIRWFKTMTTNEYMRYVKNHFLKKFNKRLWQKSFHDHIIRGDEDYRKIWEYIDTNPLKWELDCFYTKTE